ncbi:MAG: Flp family type IVb pilin [Acidobacteria bacterium]|nr:Flp family type IVb pilin [Acidobacteriota bacterium]
MRRRVSGEAGQDLVEYGLLMALIAVVAMAGVTTLGNTITNVMWNTIVNNF